MIAYSLHRYIGEISSWSYHAETVDYRMAGNLVGIKFGRLLHMALHKKFGRF